MAKQKFKAGGTLRKWWSIGMASTAIVMVTIAKLHNNGRRVR